MIRYYLLLWACVLAGGMSLRELYPGRWRSFKTPRSELLRETYDCWRDSPRRELDVTARSADTLFRRGAARVLLGDGDGCLPLNSTVLLRSAVRSRKTKTLYHSRSWADARVARIVRPHWELLSSSQRQSSVSRSSHVGLRLVTLVAVPGERPLPPPLVPSSHPAAEIIDLATALSRADADELVVLHFSGEERGGKNRLAVDYRGRRSEVTDPDNEVSLATERPRWLDAVPRYRRLAVVPEDETDLRGYNLLSALNALGFSGLHWVREGFRGSPRVPQRLAALETVDCWEALRLRDEGVALAETLVDDDRSRLWLGQHEYDRTYYQAAAALLERSPRPGYWLPGGRHELDWCAEHDSFASTNRKRKGD
jgi:hypothetical protein